MLDNKTHEINNLVSFVHNIVKSQICSTVAFSEQLKKTRLSSKQKHLLEAIENSNYSLARNVEELYSIYSEIKPLIQPSSFDLVDTLQRIVKKVASLPSSRNLSIHLEDSVIERPYVYFDYNHFCKIIEVIANLISGVAQKGIIHIKNYSSMRATSSFVILDLIFSGEIDKFNIKVLYEIFKDRLHIKKIEADFNICYIRKILHDLDGEIIFLRNIDGFKLRLKIPRSTIAADEVNTSKNNENLIMQNESSHKLSLEVDARNSKSLEVLVIEDSPLCSYAIEQQLVDLGCNVKSVFSAEEAGSIFNKLENRFDFVLTDIVLPGESGLEFAEKVCSYQSKGQTKIVALTAYLPESYETQELISSGFFEAVLNKPVSQEQLREIFSI